MSELLLLKNPQRCPACGKARGTKGTGKCSGCNVMLFPACPTMLETNPDRHGGATRRAEYELATSDASWWAFDGQRGWMHRDHWSMNIRPNPRNLTADDLGTNRRETATKMLSMADCQRMVKRERTKYKGKRIA